jgi:ABC-type sugar transport system ATPase subunit
MSLPKLEIKDVSKTFPGVKALINVDFDLREGEIISLVGENGAGKSTLINVITGQIIPDSGSILINGKKAHIATPSDAMALGIGLVPQELNLIPQLSVAENIFLGVKNIKKAFPYRLDWKTMYHKAEEIIRTLGVNIDVRAIVGFMSVANQQLVQIARAIAQGADVLIFDEPTACLTINETRHLLDLIMQFRGEGKSIIFVSHHLDEVMEISDRASVMRDGELIETIEKKDFSMQRIIKGMVGKELKQNTIRRESREDGRCVLKVEGLSRKNEFSNISFEVAEGEIFGIAGLVGAGRTELVSAIFGDRRLDSGTVWFEGKPVKISNPKKAIDMGIGYLPEERRNYGILPSLNIRENITIPNLKRLFKFPVIDRKAERAIVSEYTSKVRVKMSSPEALLTKLSGGNQQKVILSRWLAVGSKLLILDEPTRGIDVLAKEEIHQLIRECADNGMTVVVVSSELEELINICGRILIMHEGQCKGFVNAKDVNPEKILNIALS